jgi:hypothetical protein
MEKLQTHLDRLGEWAVENEIKMNPNKSKAIRFTRARGKDQLNYSLRNQNISDGNFCKYLGIVMQSDLSWAQHIVYTVQKAWRELYF